MAENIEVEILRGKLMNCETRYTKLQLRLEKLIRVLGRRSYENWKLRNEAKGLNYR